MFVSNSYIKLRSSVLSLPIPRFPNVVHVDETELPPELTEKLLDACYTKSFQSVSTCQAQKRPESGLPSTIAGLATSLVIQVMEFVNG